ncbi:hypothetical protein [Methylobacterium radiotolerans]|jgi:hypothetical protein|uniref:hypothetical protein n=1 Tax=Methylobacterium radiotolerans TaxID=31998 RepID=UPI001F309EE8|nr:hypothetical protein [Methylobacterium radiotolerans]UIY43508.1 hypothetical protein LZ599_07350 [Methylobacterium radiotolerans]
MADDIKLTVTLDASLAAALRQAAVDRGWSPESLAADCIRQQLEVATRHRVLIERMETIDAALMGVAEAIGALAEPGEGSGIDLSRVCRYRS